MSAHDVSILFKGIKLQGALNLPDSSSGLVIFAHGSGSSRHSPRNQAVAKTLQHAGLGTLLVDLLTAEEEEAEAYTRHLRFNIPFLSERLVAITRWAADRATTRDIPIGFFGSSTGAAAALIASTQLRETIVAMVSRGGRPDLAAQALPNVTAATLLIVGKEDTSVLPLNEDAYTQLQCEKALRIVPGASHLFEEEGKLEIVAQMAAEWFANHFHPMRV
ncbi:MAG TPA: alpha/beta hydrolase [Verrucomicrobiae bacterium]|nr:alpha/beta hydrolase [Verrucomicrobiae bacterium]